MYFLFDEIFAIYGEFHVPLTVKIWGFDGFLDLWGFTLGEFSPLFRVALLVKVVKVYVACEDVAEVQKSYGFPLYHAKFGGADTLSTAGRGRKSFVFY